MSVVGIDDLKQGSVATTEPAESGQVIINPNLLPKDTVQQKVVSPEELGFQPAPQEEEKSDIFDALAMADEMIDRKIEEVKEYNDAVDIDGEITEAELRQVLNQEDITKHLKDISEEELAAINNKRIEEDDASYQASKISSDEDDEDYDIDDEYTPQVQPVITPAPITPSPVLQEEPSVSYKDEVTAKTVSNASELPTDIHALAFPDDEFGDDDDLDDDDEKTEQKKEEDEQLELLKEAVKSKIKPVAKVYDLKSFTLSKKPVGLNSTLSKVEGPQTHVADWVLYSSGRPVTMRGFTGNELEKLNNPGASNTLNRERTRYNMIFEHIIDANKPNTMDEWAKCTSFLDIEHLWMAIYRSCFDGSNFIPYNCTNEGCSNKAFLSDNIDIMEMVKFKNDEAKAKFNQLMVAESNYTHKYYTTELVQVSDNFAFAMKEPSIYNMIFEIAMLDDDFVNKYREVLTIITYIDEIYFIDAENSALVPVGFKQYPNNHLKTIKSKIAQFSKVIRTLSSDQYNAILQYINKISEGSDDIVYQLPEVTCSECNTVIPAQETSASSLVFTRHQLTTLAAM